jgi:hypothetical protein
VGVEVLKHKPGRRCSMVYSVEDPQGRHRLFAKAYSSARGVLVLDTLSRLSPESGPAPPDGRTGTAGTGATVPHWGDVRGTATSTVLFPRPLGYLEDLRLLVTEHFEGADVALALYAGEADEAARRAAAAAAALHRSGARLARDWSVRDELENTAIWIARSMEYGLAARARSLLTALRELSLELPGPVELASIHRDFHPEQVLDCGARTAVIDLDDARLGDTAVDLGNFLAHLSLRPVQFPETRNGCARARPAFLEAYEQLFPGGGVAGARGRRVRFYETVSLLRLSAVYAQRERWASVLPPRLLDLCERTLGTPADPVWET